MLLPYGQLGSRGAPSRGPCTHLVFIFLVVLKEALDLSQPVLWQLADVIVVLVAGVMAVHGNDFVIPLTLIQHAQHTNGLHLLRCSSKAGLQGSTHAAARRKCMSISQYVCMPAKARSRNKPWSHLQLTAIPPGM